MARTALGMVVLGLVLAGCSTPAGNDDPPGEGGPTSTSASRLTSTTTELPDEARVIVNGTVVPLRDGFVANVTAYNPGPETFGLSVTYLCAPGHGAWRAELSGPPGDDLAYESPRATTQYSCNGFTGHPMPPRTFFNWTFHGDWAQGSCSVHAVCDNWWDGNLTLDDGRVRAPPGDYTWTFTFTYSVGASGGPTGIEREALEFTVTIPTAA